MEYHRTKIIPKCIIITSLFSSSLYIDIHMPAGQEYVVWKERSNGSQCSNLQNLLYICTMYTYMHIYTEIYLYTNPKYQENCSGNAPKGQNHITFPFSINCTVDTQHSSRYSSINLGTDHVSKQLYCLYQYCYPY